MRWRAIRRFSLHYLEMVVVMLLGMMLFFPAWDLLVDRWDVAALRTVEADTLAMATTMAVPMAGWMRIRGHAWAPALEMSAAMYAGFVVTYPFLWAGALDGHGAMMIGHVLMFVAMLVVMLLRRDEYAGCRHVRSAEAAGNEVAAGMMAR